MLVVLLLVFVCLKISEMCRLLHDRGISTFLVTNAQFPEAIASLDPVTQLYVSIDAATRDTLKAVDRPLFKDFWERFLASLRMLRDKRQRTVYRLTLVKAYNMTEVEEYCKLLDVGEPDFIEIKAVTYCGNSDASPLTIKNSPWHEEVVAFGQALADATDGRYELACAHAHSCCILLAKKEFKIDGVWHTWIDYPRFNELITRYHESNGRETFSTMDYIAPTAPWAVFGAPEAGGCFVCVCVCVCVCVLCLLLSCAVPFAVCCFYCCSRGFCSCGCCCRGFRCHRCRGCCYRVCCCRGCCRPVCCDCRF